MPYFSWRTQDTDRSIANIHSPVKSFPVVMTDNKGRKWVETDYDGYGIFGGKDFYELLAEMNGKSTREEGINLAYGETAFISPNLTEDRNWVWINRSPIECEHQGYFYYESDEDEDDDFYEDEENEDDETYED